jgi:FkbM family methyltransferase
MSIVNLLREIGCRIASKTGLYNPARILYRTFLDIPGKKRRRAKRDFYEQIIKPGDLVFDVGANVGTYSEVFASLGAHVIAIEPLPDNARILRNCRYQSRIKVLQMAVGAQEGTGKFRVASSHAMGSMSSEWIEIALASPRLRGCTWGKEIEVTIATLDTLSCAYGVPDFIKIDVEGYEECVLEGLSVQPRCLSFEFNPEILQVVDKCLQKPIFDPSSECNYVVGEPAQFSLDHWESREVVMSHLRDARVNSYGDIFVRRPLTGSSRAPAIVGKSRSSSMPGQWSVCV